MQGLSQKRDECIWLLAEGRGVRPVILVDLCAEGLKVVGGMEEGDFVVARFALHSGLRQSGSVFDAFVTSCRKDAKALVGDPVGPRP